MIAQQAPYNALIKQLSLGSVGMTVAVKDCIDIAGEVTACGSAALAHSKPAERHAEVVSRLLEQDCRIIGKANMHELAYGMTGINAAYGTPVNPRWPNIIPGGSSSGSAVAVAAGLCDFAIGTDTGGSVRQPAICCGMYGIKPTFGQISRAGCHPPESSLDCVGVIAASMATLTRAMEIMDPEFSRTRIDTLPRIARVLTDEGGDLIDHMMADLPVSGTCRLDMGKAFEAGMTIIDFETASAFGFLLDADTDLGTDIRARLAAARNITPDAIAHSEEVRTRFTRAVDAALENADALILPALPCIPPTIEEVSPSSILPLTRYLRPFNLSGHPAIVLPGETRAGGLPVGLQIVGQKGDEARLCAVAEWITSTCPAFRKEEVNA